ncbi:MULTISPECIES: hypothetical protein [Thiothrix]|jgi:hypothetical protein|uniref:hypothetical protein n=1 Tax=Thiothrix TaxID=1030 RepID=UPI00257C705A|nr:MULTISPECIES: hypothetical protein [Thiothrix]MDX9990114.1 hypothetical protein [Thiothrix unzii]
MKKQLIIAAIACAVSGAAFAAPTGGDTQEINLNLHVEPVLPTLAITFSALNPNIDFDTTALPLPSNGGAPYPKQIIHSLGQVNVDVTGIPTTTNNTHAKISVDSTNGWKLLGPLGQETPYTLLDGDPVNINSFNISNSLTGIPSLPILGNEVHYSKNWYVKIPIPSARTVGDHTDTITITTSYEASAGV